MTLRVAFIGAGQMARHHAGVVRRLSVPAVPVGVHDPIPGRADELAAFLGCQAFRSFEALLRDGRPDVVHVCTPPEAHFAAASAALESGASVYVEKPFALTHGHARALVDLARRQRVLVCAGHQLLRDPALHKLFARANDLGSLVQVDSHFAFRPVGVPAGRSSTLALARQLVDILPHPLYSLVAVLERCSRAETISLDWIHTDREGVQAILRAGSVVGRLSVSLRARPVASFITLVGTHGSLTCDFMRSTVVGAANPGTEALEKILNPLVEGAQLGLRSGVSLLRRLRSGTAYPGLAELIETFYRSVAAGGPSPITSGHLLCVSELFERLVARIHGSARWAQPVRLHQSQTDDGPLVAVTGASGFLGAEICRALPRTRGIGRSSRPEDPRLEQWVTADLSSGPCIEAVAGADVVVHAAAETSGGYTEHQRNTIDSTRHLLYAMKAAGTSRLVLVSSLSVLRPPTSARELQDEHTPRATNPKIYGPYTWGKCEQEQLVEREAKSLGIDIRIIRPGALIDWRDPSLPGLVGRRLFGQWHMGLGHPGLPTAVCDVERCAEVIAWCAVHFDEAPPVINLLDPSIATRGDLLDHLRAAGWTGRVLWFPIAAVALGLMTARTGLALLHGRRPTRLAVWSILRPRRYSADLAGTVLQAARQQVLGPVHVPDLSVSA